MRDLDFLPQRTPRTQRKTPKNVKHGVVGIFVASLLFMVVQELNSL